MKWAKPEFRVRALLAGGEGHAELVVDEDLHDDGGAEGLVIGGPAFHGARAGRIDGAHGGFGDGDGHGDSVGEGGGVVGVAVVTGGDGVVAHGQKLEGDGKGVGTGGEGHGAQVGGAIEEGDVASGEGGAGDGGGDHGGV